MIKIFKKMKKREWVMSILCVLLVLGQIYFDLKLPDYMSDLTILIENGGTISDVIHTGLEMLACALASAGLAIICGYLAARVAAGLSFTVRSDVFNQVADFGEKEMQSFSVPSLINRTTNDITQIQMLVAMGLQMIVKAPVTAIWAVVKIVNKSWTLSAITAGFVLALLVMMGLTIVVILPRFRKVQRLTDNLNQMARENLTGISVVHAYNAEDYQNDKFAKPNEEMMRTQLFNQRRFALLVPSVTLAMNALALIIYWVGAGIVNAVPAADLGARVSTLGDIVVFGTYATFVIMSIMMLVMIVMMFPSAQVSAKRINQVLDTKSTLVQGTESTASEEGTVEFRHVSFRYTDSAANVLSDITFKAGKGETVAFIGATGSGKTTLVSLAARLHDATEGEILVDGRNVRDYSFAALYDRIAYITQKAIIFSGDVRDNVLFGASRGEKNDHEVERALQIAQAKSFVQGMPDGLSSEIAQSGKNLSGGQKQRLAIARAIARRPEILIFDDSFSALDYKTDSLLRHALATDLKDTTCLIVAQRIGTVKNADRIVVIDNGKAVGIGTHAELLKTCPVYREIAMSQLSEKELEVA